MRTARSVAHVDFPIYCQRLSFFPEVPEHETVADLFLPLR